MLHNLPGPVEFENADLAGLARQYLFYAGVSEETLELVRQYLGE